MLGDTSCISYSKKKKNPRVNKEMMMMMMMILFVRSKTNTL